MSNDSKAGQGVLTGLALGTLAILGGPAAVIAGIVTFAGTFCAAKTLRDRNKSNKTDDYYDSPYSIPELMKKYPSAQIRTPHIPTMPEINVPIAPTPLLRRTHPIISGLNPGRYEVYDIPSPRTTPSVPPRRTYPVAPEHNPERYEVYDIPPPRTTPRARHNEFEPTRTYQNRSYQAPNRTEQNHKRFRISEVGEIFEE